MYQTWTRHLGDTKMNKTIEPVRSGAFHRQALKTLDEPLSKFFRLPREGEGGPLVLRDEVAYSTGDNKVYIGITMAVPPEDDMNKYISDEEMPRYYRKVDTYKWVNTVRVRAVKIISVETLGVQAECSMPDVRLVMERPFSPRDVTMPWTACWTPHPGGYFVLNDSHMDGMATCESADRFEKRYARVPASDEFKGRGDMPEGQDGVEKGEALTAKGIRKLAKQDVELRIRLRLGEGLPKLVVRRNREGEHLDISIRVAEELLASGMLSED